MAGADLMQNIEKFETRASSGNHLVKDIDANVDRFNKTVGYGKSYDIILRRFTVAGVAVAAYVINGYFETLPNMEILARLSNPLPQPGADRRAAARQEGEGHEASGPEGRGDRLSYLRQLLQERLTYSQVIVVDSFDEAVLQLLSGPMIVLVDGEAAVIVVDTRYYPDREPTAPVTEQVINGPRDGFVENFIDNTALIRRRVRDPGIRFELHKVSARGRTDVAITYIEGITNPKLVAEVRRRLKAIHTRGIPTSQEAMAEFMGNAPWNPFPMVRTTQRPDVAAINLFEGHVLLVVDTTPVVVVLPATLLQMLQHPEDYYVSPVFGTYMRWVEWVALLGAVLVPPFWLLLATHPGAHNAIPALSFIGAKKPSKIPLALQFILAEVTIDILRRSILNSTQALATTFGILGAVVLGDVSTKTGIFSSEALVYVVFAALSSFAVSNLELGMTTRLIRISLIILEWMWAFPGIIVGLLFWLVLAARSESFGVPYLWPLAPFDWPSLRSVLIRQPHTWAEPRPGILGPQDRWHDRP